MKNKLLFVLLLAFSFYGHSQKIKKSKIDHLYKVTKLITAYTVIVPPAPVANVAVALDAVENNYAFTGDTKEIPSGALIQIVDTYQSLYIASIVGDVKNELFSISATQLAGFTTRFGSPIPLVSFASAAITVPIKIRFGDGSRESDLVDENGQRRRFSNFEGNVNIGATAGIRLRLDLKGRSFLSLIGGLSLGSTKVTEDTADVKNEIAAATLSPFSGILFEYDDFQVGTFLGWDHLDGVTGRTWVYQGKPWLGVGLGYKIFSGKKSNSDIDQLEEAQKINKRLHKVKPFM